MAAASALSLLGDQMLYSVLPSAYGELGLVPIQVGLVLSMNRWVRLLTNHLAARLCERCDMAWLAGLAFTGGALTTFAYALAPHFWLLLTARMGWGLCWSFIRQIGIMTAADTAPEGHLGRTMGFHSGISRTGSVGGNVLGAVGHDLIGFAATTGIFGLVSLLSVPLGVLSRKRLRHAPPPHRPGGTDRAPPVLIGCGFIAGCVGPGLLMSMLGLLLLDTVGTTLQVGPAAIGVATLTGFLMAVRWLSDLVGSPVMGHLSDRLGRSPSRTVYFAVGGAGMLVGAISDGLFPLILAVGLFFLAAVGVTTVLMADAGARGPRTVASFATASDIGAAVGPILGWSTQQLSLSTDAIFGVGAGLYAVGALLCIFFDPASSRRSR